MDDSEFRAALGDLGLSEKATSAYLAVLERGVATTAEVADGANVTQSYVYEVAETLADRGLVTVDDCESPTTIRARPPEEALDTLSTRLSTLRAGIEDRYESSPTEPPALQAIETRRTLLRRVRSLIAGADDELLLVVPADAIDLVAADLADAVDRGITVYCLIADPTGSGATMPGEDPGQYAHVVRRWDARPYLFVKRDRSAAVVASFDALGSERGDEPAFAIHQSEVASAFYGNVVSNFWSMGAQIYLAEPPDLPATFDLLRSAVTAAAIHKSAGHDLVADVEATEVATGDPVSFEAARVREVKQSLVEPTNASFPIENALVVDTGDQLASVGGQTSRLGPYYEEYAAGRVVLRRE